MSEEFKAKAAEAKGISIELIKKLKELSGVGLTDAKKALVEAKGNFDQALDAMPVTYSALRSLTLSQGLTHGMS